MEVIPPLGLNSGQMEEFTNAMTLIEESYKWMRNEKLTAQMARDILPTCLKTEIVMTANFREWRHFIKLRGGTAAHPKIRTIAAEILNILKEQCPAVFDDLSCA